MRRSATTRGLSQNDLAALTNRDKSLIVGVVNTLEDRGCIVRKRSESDRRWHELYVTSQGLLEMQEITDIIAHVEAKLLADMPKRSIATLRRLLDQARRSSARSAASTDR